MATPVTDRQRGRPVEVGHVVPVPLATEHYGRMNRMLFYVPRFTRHFRRRLKAQMTFGDAWRSARRRMWQY